MDTADRFPTQRGPRENVVSAQVDTEGRIWSVQGLRLEADRASGVARSRPQDLPPPPGRRWTEKEADAVLKDRLLASELLPSGYRKTPETSRSNPNGVTQKVKNMEAQELHAPTRCYIVCR